MTDMKWVEIRDRGTCIPALALWITGDDHKLARRAGFGERGCVQLVLPASAKTQYDAYAWGDRTLHVAHLHLETNWHEIREGAVIDVEFLLGETTTPKESDL